MGGVEKCPSLLLLFLFTMLLSTYVFGLLKLQSKDAKSLVENAKPGMVYLFQFPRTATTPSHAALSLKVETWLKWEKIPFRRLSNQFLLGSKTDGTAPFAYFLDKYGREHWIDGSDTIIDFVSSIGKYGVESENKEKRWRLDELEVFEEKKLREKIDNTLFKILMLDRVTRDGNHKGGLDWMLEDEGIAAQMMPMLVPSQKEEVLTIGNAIYITLNADSWKTYFDVYDFSSPDFEGGKYFPGGKCPKGGFHSKNPCELAKIEFLQNFLEDKTHEDILKKYPFPMLQWHRVSDAIRKVVHLHMRQVFKDAGLDVTRSSNGERKLDQLLLENNINPQNNSSESFYRLFAQGKEQLEAIFVRLRAKTAGDFLFGIDPAPADASLFGVLVQFLETPLNIPELRDYFQPLRGVELNKDVQLLKDFVNRVKKNQNLDDENWTKLTQKPWTLNYEKPDLSSDKFDGPFRLESGSLKDIFFGGLENIKSKVVAAAVKKIKKYVVANHFSSLTVELKMCRRMAAYLCNLGKGKAAEEKCALKHREKAEKLNTASAISHKRDDFAIVKHLTYESIVEYNEGLVRTKVLEAIENADKLANNDDEGCRQCHQ